MWNPPALPTKCFLFTQQSNIIEVHRYQNYSVIHHAQPRPSYTAKERQLKNRIRHRMFRSAAALENPSVLRICMMNTTPAATATELNRSDPKAKSCTLLYPSRLKTIFRFTFKYTARQLLSLPEKLNSCQEVY